MHAYIDTHTSLVYHIFHNIVLYLTDFQNNEKRLAVLIKSDNK